LLRKITHPSANATSEIYGREAILSLRQVSVDSGQQEPVTTAIPEILICIAERAANPD
jgi:hypothetical protein